MNLGNKIRILRENKNWRQKDLADKLFCSEDTVSKWELGVNQPTVDRIESLAELFEISPGDLLDKDYRPIEIEEIDFLPAELFDGDSDHQVFDVGLRSYATLHRFNNRANAPYSAIYLENREIMNCEREREPGMIICWNQMA